MYAGRPPFLALIVALGLAVAGCSDDDGATNDNNSNNVNNNINTGDEVCDDLQDNDDDGLIDCADPNCELFGACEPTETRCDDGFDNDGDGDTDCDDADCDAVCSPTYEQLCNDGIDNDGDGDTDCADLDCSGSLWCESPEVSCDDGFDNDGDGQIDCADADCDGEGACEATETSCGDGIDNDSDDATDCADSDCVGQGLCEATELSCGDAFDNDGDGATDCDDTDCDGDACGAHGFLCSGASCVCSGNGAAAEATEISCGDLADNDCDGLVDCGDPDCFGAASCTTETHCDDGFDNDADNQVDCADPDCDTVGPCEYGQEHTCDDAIDNDADGDTDCADPDCVGVGFCQASETLCTDGHDNDGDGDTDCADSTCDGVSCGANGYICQGGGCVCKHGSSVELFCLDGIDNDCDGLLDCDDPNCAADAFCLYSGETCAEAIPLPGPGNYPGNTTGMDADLNPGAGGCTGQQAAGPDIVYRVTVPAGMRLVASLAPSGSWEAALYVLSGCGDPTGNCLAGSDVSGSEALGYSTAVQRTVYLVVDGRSASDAGAFVLTVTFTEAGDVCGGAPLVSSTITLMSTTVGMTDDYDLGTTSCLGGTATPAPDRVYAIPMTYGVELKATLRPFGWDGALSLSSSCADIPDSCLMAVDTPGPDIQETLTYASQQTSEIVYLVLDGVPADASGMYQLELAFGLATHDICPFAKPIPAGGATFHDDSYLMHNDYDPGPASCVGAAQAGPDAAYVVTLNLGETLDVTVTPTGSANIDISVYLLVGDCATPSACAAGSDTGGNGASESFSYVATANNQTVYVIVDADSTGDYYDLEVVIH